MQKTLKGVFIAAIIAVAGCASIPAYEYPNEVTVCDDTVTPDCAPTTNVIIIDE